MTKQEVIDSAVKAVKKHLEENEYCTIAITRKGYEIKSIISIYEGNFETVTTQAGMTCEIERSKK